MVSANDLRKEIADVRVEPDAAGGVWWATSELRWQVRRRPSDNSDYVVLQQRWFGSGGREEWRDVPTIQRD